MDTVTADENALDSQCHTEWTSEFMTSPEGQVKLQSIPAPALRLEQKTCERDVCQLVVSVMLALPASRLQSVSNQ